MPQPAAAGKRGPACLDVRDVTAHHGSNPVLHGVQLQVGEGALAAVLGPSGCGKTTLLRVIAGLHRPHTGTVRLHDTILDADARHLAPNRRRIGYIPQDAALFPHLSVAANIGYALPHRARRSRVPELLDLTGLTGLAARHPYQLSGGQQQRVALARALAPRPALLLLDEPFAALDGSTRRQVRTEVITVIRAAGATGVLVTHP